MNVINEPTTRSSSGIFSFQHHVPGKPAAEFSHIRPEWEKPSGSTQCDVITPDPGADFLREIFVDREDVRKGTYELYEPYAVAPVRSVAMRVDKHPGGLLQWPLHNTQKSLAGQGFSS
jgi:hypothetical protein